MAKNNVNTEAAPTENSADAGANTPENTVQSNAKPSAATNPTKYSVDELTAVSKEVFKCQPEVITGALSHAGKRADGQYTVDEVKTAIEKFKKKEVK